MIFLHWNCSVWQRKYNNDIANNLNTIDTYDSDDDDDDDIDADSSGEKNEIKCLKAILYIYQTNKS